MDKVTKSKNKSILSFLHLKLRFVFGILFLGVIAFYIAFHIVDMIFGDNSLDVYLTLKSKEEYLQNEILRLQADNARLQKEYFELKNLEPKE